MRGDSPGRVCANSHHSKVFQKTIAGQAPYIYEKDQHFDAAQASVALTSVRCCTAADALAVFTTGKEDARIGD